VKLAYESSSLATANVQSRERYDRALKRPRISLKPDDEVATSCLTEEISNEESLHVYSSVAVQTDPRFGTAVDICTPHDDKELQSQLGQTKKENDAIKSAIEKLEEKVNESSFDEF
jgi:hypothetical protein